MSPKTDADPDLTPRVVDSLPVNIAVLDEAGTIVYTDESWQRFAAANDLDGEPDTLGADYLAVAEDTDELGADAAAGLRAVLAGEQETYSLEYPCHSPEEQRWFMMWAGGFQLEGENYATVGHFDITDRVSAENELAATAEEQGEQRDQLALLNQVVRHDIRNDLQLIASFADLLEEDLADAADDEARERLDRIRRQSHHVLELTDAIGDLATLITGESDHSVEPVDLAAVLRDELDKLRRMYGTEETELTITGKETLPIEATVLADSMATSVVGNILRNAVVHNNGDHVDIAVSMAVEADRVVLTVADDGPGVPPERRRAVFGRGEKGLESPGSGLGLYLVDRLVDAYGGDVWIEDGDMGGAAFKVALRRPA